MVIVGLSSFSHQELRCPFNCRCQPESTENTSTMIKKKKTYIKIKPLERLSCSEKKGCPFINPYSCRGLLEQGLSFAPCALQWLCCRPFPSTSLPGLGGFTPPPTVQLGFVSGNQRTRPCVFIQLTRACERLKKASFSRKRLGWAPQAGPAKVSALHPHWDSSVEASWGCDGFLSANHHEKDPHWQHTWCWWWGALPSRVPCWSFPCTAPAAGSRHTFPPPVPQGKGLVSKKCAKRRVWVQVLGPGGAGLLCSSLEGRQCLLQHRGWR